VNQHIFELLEKRLGRLHARLRLGLEDDREAQVFGQGINYFHFENLRAAVSASSISRRKSQTTATPDTR
jgi:hypothetical protein